MTTRFAEVMFEQREIGYQNYGCELPPIDFVAFAKACGAEGLNCEQSTDPTSMIRVVLARTQSVATNSAPAGNARFRLAAQRPPGSRGAYLHPQRMGKRCTRSCYE